ncbi:twin-arginine translocation signal domain-containing protein [Williamsia sterculiae]|uniref:twin-arginine translocation signal domain-containing protein n=1 Tax=Williamsia sterculiae TaxID=1344003 RepID=UPI0013567099|nr:twin-arginine translocation signal domain-containing protein [Williamsia sterculiae]
MPTRRQFLYGTGIGALSAGAVAVGASSSFRDDRDPVTRQAPTGTDGRLNGGEPIVAVLRDAGTGEFAVLAGEREVVVVDKRLAATFARAVSADDVV